MFRQVIILVYHLVVGLESKFHGDFNIKVGTTRAQCPYHVLKAETLFYCVDICASYTDCEAVTYGTEKANCELFIRNQDEAVFSQKTNRLYIDMAILNNLESHNPCYTRPCGPGKRCVPDKGSYICITPDPCPSMHLVYGKCGVPVANIIASSGDVPKKFGLEVGNDWCAEIQRKHEWIQIRFESEKIIKEIITRGGRYKENWVESFAVQYSTDCINFKYARNSPKEYQEFEGNMDKSSYKHNIVQYRFQALCMRVGALTWHGKICMRLEVNGCDPY